MQVKVGVIVSAAPAPHLPLWLPLYLPQLSLWLHQFYVVLAPL
jgi:hypothetical protein